MGSGTSLWITNQKHACKKQSVIKVPDQSNTSAVNWLHYTTAYLWLICVCLRLVWSGWWALGTLAAWGLLPPSRRSSGPIPLLGGTVPSPGLHPGKFIKVSIRLIELESVIILFKWENVLFTIQSQCQERTGSQKHRHSSKGRLANTGWKKKTGENNNYHANIKSKKQKW